MEEKTGMTNLAETVNEDMARAKLALAAAAYAFGAPLDAVAAERRGGRRDVTRVRQVAMYLAHVGFGMNLARVAMAFGRDRSTAAYACHKIEDERDDPALDAQLDALEDCLRAAPAP